MSFKFYLLLSRDVGIWTLENFRKIFKEFIMSTTPNINRTRVLVKDLIFQEKYRLSDKQTVKKQRKNHKILSLIML